jgi:hexosaminidase
MSQTFPRKALTVSVVLFLWALVTPQQGLAQDRVSIVPRPVKVEVKRGHFILGSNTRVMIESESDAAVGVAVNLASKLRQVTGYALELERPEKRKYKDAILLRTSPGLAKLGNEGYRLSVTKDEVAIEAFAPAGLFYGVQSLYQLLPPEIERMAEVSGISWTVPCVRIEDMPRFSWRGVHLDVGRHFFSKDAVKKYLDYLAMYKMNTFHWHLTEDQGWRIEIKKYPRLTETGAWRKETTDDEVPYDGFYTQEDVREVVDYARERFITVVPEIEMPGHCLAALTSYPWLS